MSKTLTLPDYVHRDIAHATRIQLADPFQCIYPGPAHKRCSMRLRLSEVLARLERAATLGLEF